MRIFERKTSTEVRRTAFCLKIATKNPWNFVPDMWEVRGQFDGGAMTTRAGDRPRLSF
jgi:hypothetical protein